MMQTPHEEIGRLHKEHEKITPIVHAWALKVEEVEKVLRHFSKLFSAAWQKRDAIERRLMILEKKVKYLKPHQGQAAVPKTKDTTKALLKKLKPEELKALMAILQKETPK